MSIHLCTVFLRNKKKKFANSNYRPSHKTWIEIMEEWISGTSQNLKNSAEPEMVELLFTEPCQNLIKEYKTFNKKSKRNKENSEPPKVSFKQLPKILDHQYNKFNNLLRAPTPSVEMATPKKPGVSCLAVLYNSSGNLCYESPKTQSSVGKNKNNNKILRNKKERKKFDNQFSATSAPVLAVKNKTPSCLALQEGHHAEDPFFLLHLDELVEKTKAAYTTPSITLDEQNELSLISSNPRIEFHMSCTPCEKSDQEFEGCQGYFKLLRDVLNTNDCQDIPILIYAKKEYNNGLETRFDEKEHPICFVDKSGVVKLMDLPWLSTNSSPYCIPSPSLIPELPQAPSRLDTSSTRCNTTSPPMLPTMTTQQYLSVSTVISPKASAQPANPISPKASAQPANPWTKNKKMKLGNNKSSVWLSRSKRHWNRKTQEKTAIPTVVTCTTSDSISTSASHLP